jgi:hypothetical protein
MEVTVESEATGARSEYSQGQFWKSQQMLMAECKQAVIVSARRVKF